MDIDTTEETDYLIEQLNTTIARSHYISSGSERRLNLAQLASAQELHPDLVTHFDREIHSDPQNEFWYVQTTVTFQDFKRYSYRNGFTHRMYKVLSKLYHEDKSELLSLDFFDKERMLELELAAANKTNTIKSKPPKTVEKPKPKSELDTYAMWITEMEREHLAREEKKERKKQKKIQGSIKKYLIKKALIFSMRFVDGDQYLKLANKLESMLELKSSEEEDKVVLQKEKE